MPHTAKIERRHLDLGAMLPQTEKKLAVPEGTFYGVAGEEVNEAVRWGLARLMSNIHPFFPTFYDSPTPHIQTHNVHCGHYPFDFAFTNQKARNVHVVAPFAN